MDAVSNSETPARGAASLRLAALVVAVVGGAGSLGLVLHACARIGSPPLLFVLFGSWVAAPFVALIALEMKSGRWPAPVQTVLFSFTLLVSLVSLAIYAVVALGTARPRAPAFVIVPPISLLLLVAVFGVALLSSKRLND